MSAESEHQLPGNKGLFACSECDKTWQREGQSLNQLRMSVQVHLWCDHAIKGDAAQDRMPMTPEQIEWVLAQREQGSESGDRESESRAQAGRTE